MGVRTLMHPYLKPIKITKQRVLSGVNNVRTEPAAITNLTKGYRELLESSDGDWKLIVTGRDFFDNF